MPRPVRCPFALPDHFLDQLAYGPVVEDCGSPLMGVLILAVLTRHQGIEAPAPLPSGARDVTACAK
jgi:hypothetical protein